MTSNVSADAPHCLRGAVVRSGADVARHLCRHQPASGGRGARMTQGSAQDRRQGRLLVVLALLFFAPLGIAFYLYYGHGTWHPGGRVNAGELIEPPRPSLALPLLDSGNTGPNFLKGKWTLMYVRFGRCDEDCRTRLYDTRQVR